MFLFIEDVLYSKENYNPRWPVPLPNLYGVLWGEISTISIFFLSSKKGRQKSNESTTIVAPAPRPRTRERYVHGDRVRNYELADIRRELSLTLDTDGITLVPKLPKNKLFCRNKRVYRLIDDRLAMIRANLRRDSDAIAYNSLWRKSDGIKLGYKDKHKIQIC